MYLHVLDVYIWSVLHVNCTDIVVFAAQAARYYSCLSERSYCWLVTATVCQICQVSSWTDLVCCFCSMIFLKVYLPLLPSNRHHRSIGDCQGVRGKIIRSVLCSIVCNNCAQCSAHTWTDVTVLWIGFFHWALFTVLRFILVYVCVYLLCVYYHILHILVL